jgi:2-amino-4-hydroxy-6-hydroxymethyldihydropteridine diphosphokinase
LTDLHRHWSRPLTPSTVRVYLGLGSNIGDRTAHLARAVPLLDADARVAIRRASSVYETAPWGYEAQPPFLNMVLEAEVQLTPAELLALSSAIEERMGRRRIHKWAPRVIDIDILLYGDRVIKDRDLQVPHPLLTGRQFVLVPLLELAPDLTLPDGARVAELADPTDSGVARWSAPPWPAAGGGERQ